MAPAEGEDIFSADDPVNPSPAPPERLITVQIQNRGPAAPEPAEDPGLGQ